MEKAIYISRIEQLKFWNKKFSRIYFGNEFCHHLMPRLEKIEEVYNFSKKKKVGFTLVTPYVDEAGLKKIVKILLAFEVIDPEIEVVINDWGILNIINKKYKFANLVLGRLLNKMKRDPRVVSDNFEIPEYLLKHYQNCSLSIPWHLKFLKQNKIKRIELDNVLHGLDINFNNSDFKISDVSLYYPFGYITTTRLCKFNGFKSASPGYLRPSITCQRECGNYELILNIDGLDGIRVVQKGNTVFFYNYNFSENNSGGMINRLIEQPDIPM